MGKVISSITVSVDGYVTGPRTARAAAWAWAVSGSTTG
jgi:hypothetical protein